MPSNTTSPKGKRTGSKEEIATIGVEEETSSPEETCKTDVIAEQTTHDHGNVHNDTHSTAEA